MTETKDILIRARTAKERMSALTAEQLRYALVKIADEIDRAASTIIEANRLDCEAAKESISSVMIDRLRLNEARIKDMAEGVRSIANLPCPIGRILDSRVRPNGLRIERVAVPIGVIAIIYESRPNVTSDAAALAIGSGNTVILRSGKEAYRSAKAIVDAIRRALSDTDLPEDAVQLVEDTTRQSATELMEAVGYVDMLIPRGGAGLIRACVEKAKVPVLETGTGICHVYVDGKADQDMAIKVLTNAKTSRPSVCNACEVTLISRDIAAEFLPKLRQALVTDRIEAGLTPVELRLCPEAMRVIDGIPAGDNDFDTEFLDYTLGVKVVGDVEEAIEHIARHSTHHSESIITADGEAADRFMARVDSACVYHNASTRFTDGGEFGLGCEMGIATCKVHARGPLGLAELTTYKYKIYGEGQIR